MGRYMDELNAQAHELWLDDLREQVEREREGCPQCAGDGEFERDGVLVRCACRAGEPYVPDPREEP